MLRPTTFRPRSSRSTSPKAMLVTPALPPRARGGRRGTTPRVAPSIMSRSLVDPAKFPPGAPGTTSWSQLDAAAPRPTPTGLHRPRRAPDAAAHDGVGLVRRAAQAGGSEGGTPSLTAEAKESKRGEREVTWRPGRRPLEPQRPLPELAKLLEQYGCGPIAFTGTDNALYERHLLFDNVIDPAAAGPRERFEAVRPLGARRPLAALGAHRADLRAREPQARLLPVDGVPHRPLAGQQRHQPAARSRSRSRSSSEKNLDWLGAARAGARRGARQRRPRAPGGVLPRLDGHHAAPGDGLRPALRVRHLPADDPRTAGSASSPTTGCAVRTRGRSPGRTRRSRSSSAARSSCAAARCSRSPAGRPR